MKPSDLVFFLMISALVGLSFPRLGWMVLAVFLLVLVFTHTSAEFNAIFEGVTP